MPIPKRELYALIDAAEKDGRITGHYIYSPGDARGTRYVVWGEGCERTYNRRAVESFLASGKTLYDHEYAGRL